MKNDGGPAFANWSLQGDWQPGMTLRQYYAGQAMMGWLSSPYHVGSPEGCAKISVEYADALLAELAKEE